jgi:hydrogenase maturation factor
VVGENYETRGGKIRRGRAAAEAGVDIVTGDTKVVDKGKVTASLSTIHILSAAGLQ